ncbi:MAG: undecaprenyl-diphosphatase UppP [Chloroflexi bacterium]|nr:undecaprenyl-diphosphatase UppP [Chloroflexota bacterium]
MTILQSIVLGIVQGLTEFLPISSSGHLVLVPLFLNWHIPLKEAFIFNVLVQIATLIGVIAYFWKDLIGIFGSFIMSLLGKESWQADNTRLGWLIIIATIPAGVLGLLIKNTVEAAFASPKAVGVFLIITALMLLIVERLTKQYASLNQLNWKDALIIGFFQALSIFPGISRSGSTICGGMIQHLPRKDAAKFSFLLSIPIMLAAGFMEIIDLFQTPNVNQLLPVFLPGFFVAAITGYLSIRWLLTFLHQHKLNIFSFYLIIIGLITLILPFN